MSAMRILLDTHVFLWFISADSRLPAAFQAAIQDPTNEVYLSVASIWEAIIKYKLGKLPLPSPPAEYMRRQRDVHRIIALPVDEGTMVPLEGLSAHHRDPFDRVLIAQAIQHGLTVATVDPDVMAYPITVLPTS